MIAISLIGWIVGLEGGDRDGLLLAGVPASHTAEPTTFPRFSEKIFVKRILRGIRAKEHPVYRWDNYVTAPSTCSANRSMRQHGTQSFRKDHNFLLGFVLLH